MQLITSSNADRNLAAGATVLSTTPDASNPRVCYVIVQLGDGTKNLTTTGGAFQVTITIGGNTWLGGAQTYTLGTAPRATLQSSPFCVPAGAVVTVAVTSPNAGDTDVDCTAYIMANEPMSTVVAANVAALPTAGGIADAVWDEATSGHTTIGSYGVLTVSAIADAVWDEATSGHATAGSYGASVLIIGVDYTWTNTASGSGYDRVTVTKT